MAKEVKTRNTGGSKGIEKKQEGDPGRQFIILMGLLLLLLVSSIIVFNMLKPKPYFELQGFTVTPAPLEGTARIYYSMPITFEIGSTLYKENMLLKIDPRMLENVSVDMNPSFFGSRAEIIMLFDQEAPSRIIEAMFEMKRLAGVLNIPYNIAVTHKDGENENKSITVMQCNESNADARIIYFNGNATETKVYEDDCIKIEGSNYDELERATDAFIWQWMLAIRK